MSDWIAMFDGDLDNDATGLWEIILDGREGFGLDGKVLEDFMIRAIVVLLDAGALPSQFASPEKGYFEPWPTHYFGSSPEVASCIVKDWKKGLVDDTMAGLWFYRP